MNLHSEINDVNSNIFYQCEDVKTVNFEKFTNEEVEFLANMEKYYLYDTIQGLHQDRIKPTLVQLSIPNSEVKTNFFARSFTLSPNHKLAHNTYSHS
jgi:hypothetical protein